MQTLRMADNRFLPQLHEFYFTTAGKKNVKIVDALFRISAMTNSFEYSHLGEYWNDLGQIWRALLAAGMLKFLTPTCGSIEMICPLHFSTGPLMVFKFPEIVSRPPSLGGKIMH